MPIARSHIGIVAAFAALYILDGTAPPSGPPALRGMPKFRQRSVNVGRRWSGSGCLGRSCVAGLSLPLTPPASLFDGAGGHSRKRRPGLLYCGRGPS